MKGLFLMRIMSKKIFFFLSLLFIGQACADTGWFDTFKNGLHWTGKVYCSSLSKIERTLGWPQKSLQIGLPATAVVGLLGYLSCPPEDLQEIRAYAPIAKWTALGGATIGGGIYGLLWAKRWWDFYYLEKALDEASHVEDTIKFKKFRLSTWRKDTWATSDLENKAEEVRKKLKHDATTRSAFHSTILNSKVFKRHNKNAKDITITSDMIKEIIDEEFEQLKKNLEYVGACIRVIKLSWC